MNVYKAVARVEFVITAENEEEASKVMDIELSNKLDGMTIESVIERIYDESHLPNNWNGKDLAFYYYKHGPKSEQPISWHLKEQSCAK